MKYQGKITNWNDNKGFGFVEPNGGGDRAFVHIKSFKPRTRRPINGDVITYELALDNQKRFKAQNVKFALATKSKGKSKKNNIDKSYGYTIIVITVFCIGLLVSVLTKNLPIIVVGFYGLMSLISVIAYAIDKSAAQSGSWRTKESTLHLFSLLGGWPGAFFAQTKLRHKSSKAEFKNMYWITVFLNLCGLFWLHTDNGVYFLNNIIPI